MELSKLKEDAVHGTTEFPLAVYKWEGVGSYSVPLHWHKETEIICLESGRFRLSVNMKELVVNAPALVFVGSEEIHSIWLEEGGREQAVVFDVNMLSFENYDGVQHKMIRPLVDKKIRLPLLVDERHPIWEELSQIYQRIYKNAVKKDLSAYLKVKAELYHMLACLYENGYLENVREGRESDSYKIDTMKQVLTFIHDNYGRKIQVDEIASVAGMNSQYFCRYFKRTTGKTVTEYLNEIRINQASQELVETNDKIIEIAMRCGYDNMGYFIRRFCQLKQMTPSEYRKKSK